MTLTVYGGKQVRRQAQAMSLVKLRPDQLPTRLAKHVKACHSDKPVDSCPACRSLLTQIEKSQL